MSASDRFFAVDRRCWAAVGHLGLNEAVSYLVIAAGTGGDQRTSSWSATAVEKYTGIHHRRAAAAIERLIEAGFITVEKNGKLRRSRVQPPASVQFIISQIAASSARADRPALIEQLADPEWIWLPATLILGAADEVPPVKLLRQSQNLNALRLFVSLYYYHDLAGSGGIEWRRGSGIRQPFRRTKAGEHGLYQVWAFRSDHDSPIETFKPAPFWFEGAENDGFWPAFKLLLSAGLIEFVAHLVESDTAEAEVIAPMPWEGTGEPGERAITLAARNAGAAMAAPWFDDPLALLVPVSRLRPNVEMIGVARMKYRPHTTRTAEWMASADEWKKTAMAFEELTRAAALSGIKVESR